MKRVDFQVVLVMMSATLAACLIGCTESSDVVVRGNRSGPAATAKPAPEESFELILETFRRGVEGVKIGFVARREGGHSMMSGDNKVSHELIPPKQEGEPYKAIITVQSQSSYSLQRTTTTDDPGGDNKPSGQDTQSGIGGGDSPVDILDSDLVGTPTDATPTPRAAPVNVDSTTVARRPQTPVKKSYELQYENGRWSLMTKLDPETEQGIENAFEHALKTQI